MLAFISSFSMPKAQSIDEMAIPFGAEISKNYQNCAAIFFNDKLLVNHFSPNGECRITRDQKGELKVSTVKISDDNVEQIKDIPFRVAIKNIETNTMYLLHTEDVMTADFQEILQYCETNDQLVILTRSQLYNLTYHNIIIDWGC